MRGKFFTFLLVFAAVVMLGASASAQQKFTAALNTIQEVPPVTNSVGRGSCVLTLNVAQTQFSITCEYSGLSSGLTTGGAHIHGPAAPGANASVLFPLNPTAGTTSGTINAGPFTVTPAQVAELRAKRWYVNLHTTNNTGGEIRGQLKIQTTPFDLDGDGRTDISAYRPGAAGTTFTIFSINNSFQSNIFGFTNEVPLPTSASNDFDGDGRGDLVLLRISNNNWVWRILQTRTNTVREVFWGLGPNTDDLVPADYDGDGMTDIAVYRFSTGVWYILQSSNNQLRTEFWGQAGNPNEYGMVGDFDADGRSDLTILRYTATTMLWSTRRSSDNAVQVREWGNSATDSHIYTWAQIDVDGDGIQDRAIARDPNPASSATGDQITVFVLRSSDGGQFALPFGRDTDSPFAGDFDGDGRTDFAARRNESGTLVWYIALSSNNWNTAQPRVVRFGQAGDLLVEEAEEEFPSREPINY
ncbi:MAG: CHRD domain-containing protein [Acidobacteriota bacterium]|nr:CHRD domain-containing protein [Acidobacteriota bacterium]